MGVEGEEVIVHSRDARGSSGTSVEDFSVDPLSGIHTALDHGDAFIEDVADVGTGLGASKLIKVGDGVVVRVSQVIFCPVMLDDAVRVFLIAVRVQGIFYHHNATKQ